ncbi:hypothetical protein B0I37DRAFT_394035 [Chaetomium sp. MPI-CAGE-AT-0009]|nr:hypothetical protein B0I37DRAFT_394035 [Chaetomium sp. MPI-CAGE-AT-0009]
MSSLETTIQQAAAKNTELLRVLSETDHAPPALEQQKRLIADLESVAAESDRRLVHMEAKRKKEFGDHETYRDSVLRRFAFKATGQRAKFEARAQKEETEYFQALQAEQSQQQINRNLKEQVAAARQVATELEAQVAQRDSAQQELDRLYESIFGGPTPSLPDEDESEQRAGAALRAYQDARGRAEAEQMAVRLLADAQRGMQGATKAMEQARSASRHDMWSGGSLADVMERNALQRAESAMLAARMQVVQAQRDMAFHEEIKAAAARVQQAALRLDAIAAEAGVRAQDLDAELKRKEKDLRDARVALQKIRESAFESLSVAPPAY